MPIPLQASLPPHLPQENQKLRRIMLTLWVLKPGYCWLQLRGPKDVRNIILLKDLRAQFCRRPPELSRIWVVSSHPAPHAENSIGKTSISIVVDIESEICRQKLN